jgi:uncharacterized protein YcbK (DUF882 family)
MPRFPTATHYSANFRRRELDCRCGCKAPPEVQANLAQLAGELELLRKLTGPLTVNSGYRCVKHNAAVGGEPQSWHTRGLAADVTSPSRSPTFLRSCAEQIPRFSLGGIGTYPTWVHVDIRPHGPARWDKR